MKRFIALALVVLSTPLPAQDQKKVLLRGPYLQNVTSTSIVVRFATADEVEGVVEYGTSEQYGQKATGGKTQRHAVELKDLKPGTRYHYRANGATGSFVTAPDGDKPFEFVVYGDCRTNHKVHQKVVTQMAKVKPAFVVHTGDFADDGTRSELWTKYFEIAAELLKDAPLYPALGNHERHCAEYFEVFTIPGGGKDWYSFDYGGAHFCVLNMNSEYRKKEEQLAWAKDDLSKSKAPIKFVSYHQPAFSASADKGRIRDAEDVYATWGSIFEQNKVTAVLQGHNHNYQRAEKNGVTYLTVGGGGAPLYDLGSLLPETKFAKSAYSFVVVSVESKQVVCTAMDMNGGQLEKFTFPRK